MRTGRSLLVAALLVASLFALPVGTASAQECSLDAAELEPMVAAYNANLDRVPGVARGQLSDQRIDVGIATPGGERRFAVTTDADGRITEFSETAAEDPTLRVETSESTICDVVTANDPPTAFADAYDTGEIDVSGVGIVNSVKIGAVKVGVGVARWLSGLF